MRRWAAGWTERVAGVNLRVVAGKKSADDLRIEWLAGGKWYALPMALAAIVTDFWFENEDVLYPPPAAGGEYFLKYLNEAATAGWQTADAKLKREQQAKLNGGVQPGEPVEPPTSASDFDAGWLTPEARRAWGTTSASHED